MVGQSCFILLVMVLESECMETDPVAMMERCEREKKEAQLERHQCIER